MIDTIHGSCLEIGWTRGDLPGPPFAVGRSAANGITAKARRMPELAAQNNASFYLHGSGEAFHIRPAGAAPKSRALASGQQQGALLPVLASDLV